MLQKKKIINKKTKRVPRNLKTQVLFPNLSVALCKMNLCFLKGVFVSSSEREDVQYCRSTSAGHGQIHLLARKFPCDSAAC